MTEDCVSTSRSAWGLLSVEDNPLAWKQDALCAQVGGDEWFPEFGGSTYEARRICVGCPVRVQCLAYALANEELFGVWGGYSPSQRHQLQRGVKVPLWKPRVVTQRPPKPLVNCAACGTGFRGHGCARYCSNKCRPGKGPVQTLCEFCGTEFTGDRRTRFCSKVCRGRAYRLKTRSAA